jgi:hypothetical protein
MEVIRSIKLLVTTYKTAQCHNIEDHIFTGKPRILYLASTEKHLIFNLVSC